MRSFGFLQGACLRPSEVVRPVVSEVELVVRRAWPTFPVTPQGDKRTTKTRIPSCFPGEPALLRNLFLRNEPNFTIAEINISNCIRGIYNDFQTKLKIGTNPNEPNQSQFQSLRSPRQKNRKYLAKNKKIKSKANFEDPPTCGEHSRTKEDSTIYFRLSQTNGPPYSRFRRSRSNRQTLAYLFYYLAGLGCCLWRHRLPRNTAQDPACYRPDILIITANCCPAYRTCSRTAQCKQPAARLPGPAAHPEDTGVFDNDH